jgi:dienelactone hydrolase
MILTVAIVLAGPRLKTASYHPMQYFVSLPDGWEKGRSWPVAVVIESANRDLEANAGLFVKARRKLPFIIVAPLVVTNGGPNVRDVPTYHYSAAVWDRIQKDPWKFDSEGIAAVVADVHRQYGGLEKVDVTGWEAGCHTVWALMFDNPDMFFSAALVCPNYAGRWISPSNTAHFPVVAEVFAGAKDPGWAPGKPLYDQTQRAIKDAAARGFPNIPIRIVPGGAHGPLPDAVLRFFNQPKGGG